MGSPLLLHNIFSHGGEFGPQAPSSIYIRPCPFGSANPPIPAARSVIIARVASPNSIHRQYQSLYLHSLRRYFDAGKRWVKQNDIIAVSIDIDSSRWLERVDDDGDQWADLTDFKFVPISSECWSTNSTGISHPSNDSCANGLVCFSR